MTVHDEFHVGGFWVRRSRNMKIIEYFGPVLITLILIMGCSGNYGKIITQSGSESNVTKQELIDNSSDYDIKYYRTVVVFGTNNDKKILVPNYWSTVKNQETWAQIVEGNTHGPFNNDIRRVWNSYSNSGVREIWSPDNQFFGYVLHGRLELVSVKIVDEKTVRLIHGFGAGEMGP